MTETKTEPAAIGSSVEPTNRKFDDSNAEVVHGSYWPLNLRPDSGVLGSLSFDFDGRRLTYETNVWRISPLGAEFEEAPDMPPMNVGSIVEIKLTFRNQLCNFHGILVCRNRDGAANRTLVGVRWCEDEREESPRQSRRNIRRWICSNSFLPTAVAPNPILFNDLLLFRVVDVSKNGARLITSMRNKFIVPNMWLDGTFTFPMVGAGTGRFQVKWTELVSTDGKQDLAIGVQFDKVSSEMTKLMGEYILQFGDNTTIAEIRESGLTVRNTFKALDVGYARTEQDYRDVLELRRLTYGVYKADGDISELSDMFDARSRIIMLRHRGRCVASCRLIFHDIHDQLEAEKYGQPFKNLPRNDELVEFSRMCTHPDYRASDLVYLVLKQAFVVMIQAKRRYLLGSSPDHLLPFYERLSAKKLGFTVSPESVPGLKLHVMLADLHNAIKGIGVNPILWNAALGEDLLKHAVEKDYIRLDSLTKIRLAGFRMLKPLGRHMLRAEVKKSKKKSRTSAT